MSVSQVMSLPPEMAAVWVRAQVRARRLIRLAARQPYCSHQRLVAIFLVSLAKAGEDEDVVVPCKVVQHHRTPDWQGQILTVLVDEFGGFWTTTASFGSCSCCDYLEAAADLRGKDKERALLSYCVGLLTRLKRA